MIENILVFAFGIFVGIIACKLSIKYKLVSPIVKATSSTSMPTEVKPSKKITQ